MFQIIFLQQRPPFHSTTPHLKQPFSPYMNSASTTKSETNFCNKDYGNLNFEKIFSKNSKFIGNNVKNNYEKNNFINSRKILPEEESMKLAVVAACGSFKSGDDKKKIDSHIITFDHDKRSNEKHISKIDNYFGDRKNDGNKAEDKVVSDASCCDCDHLVDETNTSKRWIDRLYKFITNKKNEKGNFTSAINNNYLRRKKTSELLEEKDNNNNTEINHSLPETNSTFFCSNDAVMTQEDPYTVLTRAADSQHKKSTDKKRNLACKCLYLSLKKKKRKCLKMMKNRKCLFATYAILAVLMVASLFSLILVSVLVFIPYHNSDDHLYNSFTEFHQ